VIRIDLGKRAVNVKLSDSEIEARRKELMDKGGYKQVRSQTPWQEIFRREAGPLSGGMVFEDAVRFKKIGRDEWIPRDNH